MCEHNYVWLLGWFHQLVFIARLNWFDFLSFYYKKWNLHMTKKVSSYLPVVEEHNTFQSHESVNTSSWQAQLFPLRWKKAWPGAQEAVFSKAWTPCSARFQPYQTHVICVPGERLNILVPVCLSFFFLNFSKIWCHLHKLHLFCYFLVIRLAIKSSSNSIYHNVVKCLVRVKWSLPLGLCKYLCFVCSYKPFPSPPSKDTMILKLN